MGILPLFFLFKLFSMEIENFDKTRVKFLVEIKGEIFRFNSLDTTLKVSRLLATSFDILVANTQFSLALATSWSQFRTEKRHSILTSLAFMFFPKCL